MVYKIEIASTAVEALGRITDRRTSSAIARRIDALAEDPLAQGKPLRADLSRLLSVRAAGQCYRIVFRVDEANQQVDVLLVGIRKGGSRQDVYALAQRLVERGLIYQRGALVSVQRETEELSIVDARRELTKLPEKLAGHPTTVTVTRRGKPVLAIMTWDDYESILETLEILSDLEAIEQLRSGIQDFKEGRTIPWEEAKATLLHRASDRSE